MQDRTDARYPIHELIAGRWSPRAFEDRAVPKAVLATLFEAARWAASCANEQPWRYLVAPREDRDGFARFASCLVEGNSVWATKAPVLALSVAKTTFTRGNEPNRHGPHDVGQASGMLALQACAMGLQIHQMAGYDAAKARELCAIPTDHEPMAMIAIGYPGAPEVLPAKLAERERAPRVRRALEEIVFGSVWGTVGLKP